MSFNPIFMPHTDHYEHNMGWDRDNVIDMERWYCSRVKWLNIKMSSSYHIRFENLYCHKVPRTHTDRSSSSWCYALCPCQIVGGKKKLWNLPKYLEWTSSLRSWARQTLKLCSLYSLSHKSRLNYKMSTDVSSVWRVHPASDRWD